MTAGTSRLRLGVIGVTALSLFTALFARLWYLQVMASSTFRLEAQANQVRRVYEPAPRGRILDRHGRVLVDNRISQTVTVTRATARDRPDVLARLAPLLGLSPDTLAAHLADPRYSPYRPVPVAEDVSEEVVVYLREHRHELPGVEATPLAQRAYPHGTLAAHLLGSVGEVNDAELAERKKDGYRLGDSVGKTGIELVYEEALRGRPGLVELEVDSRERVVRTLDRREPVQGDDVQLTLDLDLQRITEESLDQGLAAARQGRQRSTGRAFAAPAGAAVVLDPRDGSVLAMASRPTYDPAAFVNGIRPDVFRSLQDPAGHFPLSNRAIQGQYAPGSTFKLVTSVAALTRGLIDSRTTIVDGGSLRVGNRVFRNAGGKANGRVNLVRALTVSSDVFFYQLGANFWRQRETYGDAIQASARQLGLGERLGIPLPGEKGGRVPDPESRKRLHQANPRAFPEGRWYPGDNVNLAIGQGEMVLTPLQLASAYATFANGGTLFVPRTALRTADLHGTTRSEIPPRPLRQLDLPPAVRDPILQGLRGAVAEPGGTARAAFSGFPVDTFPVAGKTGTAQVQGKQDTALFVAFAPADAPRYAVAVIMEESGFGGVAAAPVARRVLEAAGGQPAAPVSLSAGGVVVD